MASDSAKPAVYYCEKKLWLSSFSFMAMQKNWGELISDVKRAAFCRVICFANLSRRESSEPRSFYTSMKSSLGGS